MKVETLGAALLDALMQGDGVNDSLQRLLRAVAQATSVDHLALYDYDELNQTFELLYFCGFPADARSDLNRRVHALGLPRALQQREPYAAADSATQLLVPLRFQETVEAVLLLDGRPDRTAEEDGDLPRLFALISRFLGLFLSSMRLPVNQQRRVLSARELEKAREIQLSYLPVEYPATDRYEIFGYNQSAALVGGDYFDYFSERAGSIQCVVADACGHGLAAALIMSTFRGLLHSEVRREGELPSLFTRLNARLFCGTGQLQFLTGVFLDYDEERGEIRYSNAGHFEPVLVHPDGSFSMLDGGGLPLGMFQHSAYELRSRRVQSGDLVVLFTDGLVELRNRSDDHFGIEGILEATIPCRHAALGHVATTVLQAAARFSERPNPDDDLTLFLMRLR